jgi:hypothetical protein
MAESFEEAEFGVCYLGLLRPRRTMRVLSDSNLRPLSESEKYIKKMQSISSAYAVIFDHFTMRSI